MEIYNCFLFETSYDKFKIGDEYSLSNDAYCSRRNHNWQYKHDSSIDKLIDLMLNGSGDWFQELKTNIIFLYDDDGIFGYGETRAVMPSTPTNFEKGHYSASFFNLQIINKFNKNKRIKLTSVNSLYIGNKFSLIDEKYYFYIYSIYHLNANLLNMPRRKKFNLREYSYFISFAHVSNSTLLAKKLDNIFEVLGYKVWFDEKSLTYNINHPIVEIKAGIKNSEKIIIILNEEYFYKVREWTIRELYEVLTTKNSFNIKIIIVDKLTVSDIEKKFLKRLQEIDDFSKYISEKELQRISNLIYKIESIYYIDKISGKNIKQIISEL